MEKKKYGQTIIIIVLVATIVFMSIGFAAFSQTLNINGAVSVEPTRWSVHWDTTSYVKGNGSVDILDENLTVNSSPTLTNSDVTFGAKLSQPGDYAEFSINAINDGDFDAKLTAITLSSLTEAQKKYLSYTVTYNGIEYSGSTNGLSIPLVASGVNSVKVKVTYLTTAAINELPTEATTVRLTASFDYEQDV